jgi:1-phosphofructokinase family hexose kinase
VTSSGRRIVFVAANPSIDRLLEVPALEAGAIHRPDVVVAVPGGKGLNAARAAATLGGDVVAITLVGGHAGEWIGGRLAELGLEARLVDAGAETRTCVSILDRSTGELTEFYESGLPVAPGAFDSLEAAVTGVMVTGDVGWLTTSGSIPPGAPIDGQARLVRLATEHGIASIVDTHGAALSAALDERPTIVKVNAAEAGEIAGIAVTGATSAAEAARALRSTGAEGVVVTLGRDGAIARDSNGSWHLTSAADAGRYPVGSGDAFLGGLVVRLARGDTLVDAARSGMAAAIANALTAGAGLLDARDFDRLLPTVRADAL